MGAVSKHCRISLSPCSLFYLPVQLPLLPLVLSIIPTTQNPENLLIFAAGNSGDTVRSTCTIASPAIAKNVLAVGATTSGSTRLSVTEVAYPDADTSGADVVAYFSSWGPTTDDRIKPEVVAPGDMVRAFNFQAVES